MTPAADTLGVRPFAEIARGPVASVFKAYDSEAGRVVLLKALRPAAAADPERRARFANEARLASSVAHPNVVRVLRVSPDGDALVAEWVEGRDFQTFIDERGALPPGLAAVVVREAARGLAAVHAAGILHRDVKPANVLLGDDGSVRLTDFGLASLTPGAETVPVSHAEVRGTLATLAPEIVRGDAAGPASDVFSLGAVLAHALTGRAPFDAATSSDTLDAVLHTDMGATLAADPRIPASLALLTGGALDRDPAARPTADALADALSELVETGDAPETVAACFAGADAPPPTLREVPTTASPASWGSPPAASAATSRARPARLGLVAAGVIAGIAAFVWLRPDAPPVRPQEHAVLDPLVLEADPERETGDTATTLTPDSQSIGPSPAEVDAPAPEPQPRPQTPPAAGDRQTDRASGAQPAQPDAPPSPAPTRTPAPSVPPPTDTAEPRSGTLVVAAEPWATVRVDGRSVGTTPVRTALPAGTHTLTFENPGFPTHTRTVRIEPGETARTELSLWSLVARITLDVAPWAEVWVDGEQWDTVPPQARLLVLVPGEHVLRFEHPTLGRREQTIHVAAGEVRTVRVRMTGSTP